MPISLLKSAAVALVFSMSSGGLQAESNHPIAGMSPDQRPSGAPVLNKVDHSSAWYQRALTGLSSPYPASFRFLEDQGNWYTPFVRPGMTGPYDIRHWHR